MATTTQEQTVRLAPFQEEFLADIFASGKALTGEGSQMPFSPQQLAALSPAQQQAISSAMGGIGAYSPYLQRGAEAMGQGIGAVGAGLGTIGSAIGQAGQASYDPNSYQQFMDPYMNDVIQQQYQDIADQGQKQQNQLSGNAVSSGAFGGSRQGVAQGEIAGNVMDQQARTGSQLRSQGFAQAQGAAQQAAQQQLRQAQLTGQLGQSAGALGQSIGQLGITDSRSRTTRTTDGCARYKLIIRYRWSTTRSRSKISRYCKSKFTCRTRIAISTSWIYV